jgi:hypothetical protein
LRIKKQETRLILHEHDVDDDDDDDYDDDDDDGLVLINNYLMHGKCKISRNFTVCATSVICTD